MAEVMFLVEPEAAGARWCIKRGDSVRATYASRAQAVTDARQLAMFECELRANTAIVRVLDVDRHVAEDLITPRRHCAPATLRPGGARLLLR